MVVYVQDAVWKKTFVVKFEDVHNRGISDSSL